MYTVCFAGEPSATFTVPWYSPPVAAKGFEKFNALGEGIIAGNGSFSIATPAGVVYKAGYVVVPPKTSPDKPVWGQMGDLSDGYVLQVQLQPATPAASGGVSTYKVRRLVLHRNLDKTERVALSDSEKALSI